MKNYNALKTFDKIDKPTWKDSDGKIHACVVCYMYVGVDLIWTECELEPPHDQVRLNKNKITCEKCLLANKGEIKS